MNKTDIPHTPDHLPAVHLRSVPAGPQAFKRMLGDIDPKARPGSLVKVIDKNGQPYAVALYNPKSLIALRFLTRETTNFDADSFFKSRLTQAFKFRREVLNLDSVTNSYRVVYDQGDGLPGLVIDKYGDYFGLEFYSLGMFRQADRIERIIKEIAPNAQFIRRASDYTQTMEGFNLSDPSTARVRINENNVLFEADLAGGYKTGFFCDQRDNRLAASALAKGRRVLDVCSYTGGFSLYAKKLGGAEEVTAVELNPEICEVAERNANINKVRIKVTAADAFPYLRQMSANRERFGLIILDPYKLIASREGFLEGRQKYFDLNRLALTVLEPGGFLVTCSCSGLLSWEEFGQIVRQAAAITGRRLQIFRKTGAGADHPVSSDYPEGEYLKVFWCRLAL